MFGSAKPAASLSSGLLARKGQARPAMRPQGFVGINPGTSLDDLGWNDMGFEGFEPAPLTESMPPVLAQRNALAEEFAPQPPVEAPVQAAQPLPEPVAQPEPVVLPDPASPLAKRTPAIEAAPEPEAPAPRPVSTATAARIGREVASKKGASKTGKAAFTLRLDTERHLKLRLASALSGRSAQLLVTEALDAFLDTLPEVGALADRLPAGKAR